MKKNLRIKILAIGNIVAFLAVIIVNYLAVSLPIGGMSTGELSDLYPNLFVPAGLTFSIWGIIYLLLAGFVVWQLIDLYRKKSKEITKKIGIWFLFSCLLNISRIFARHYKLILLSVLIMLAFLAVLIVISYKIKIGVKIGSLGDKLLAQVPFSVYLGRICVATIANISTFLVNIGRNGFGISDLIRTNIVIVVATVLGILSLYKKNDVPYALVIVRAFLGIILKRLSVDPSYTVSIIWTTGICISILFFGIGYKFKNFLEN